MFLRLRLIDISEFFSSSTSSFSTPSLSTPFFFELFSIFSWFFNFIWLSTVLISLKSDSYLLKIPSWCIRRSSSSSHFCALSDVSIELSSAETLLCVFLLMLSPRLCQLSSSFIPFCLGGFFSLARISCEWKGNFDVDLWLLAKWPDSATLSTCAYKVCSEDDGGFVMILWRGGGRSACALFLLAILKRESVWSVVNDFVTAATGDASKWVFDAFLGQRNPRKLLWCKFLKNFFFLFFLFLNSLYKRIFELREVSLGSDRVPLPAIMFEALWSSSQPFHLAPLETSLCLLKLLMYLTALETRKLFINNSSADIFSTAIAEEFK